MNHLTSQRPTLPHSHPCSTIGAIDLNCPVRNGKECYLYAIITRFNQLTVNNSQLTVNDDIPSEYLIFESFVLSKLHIVLNVFLQLDYIGQALDLLVSVS